MIPSAFARSTNQVQAPSPGRVTVAEHIEATACRRKTDGREGLPRALRSPEEGQSLVG